MNSMYFCAFGYTAKGGKERGPSNQLRDRKALRKMGSAVFMLSRTPFRAIILRRRAFSCYMRADLFNSTFSLCCGHTANFKPFLRKSRFIGSVTQCTGSGEKFGRSAKNQRVLSAHWQRKDEEGRALCAPALFAMSRGRCVLHVSRGPSPRIGPHIHRHRMCSRLRWCEWSHSISASTHGFRP